MFQCIVAIADDNNDNGSGKERTIQIVTMYGKGEGFEISEDVDVITTPAGASVHHICWCVMKGQEYLLHGDINTGEHL